MDDFPKAIEAGRKIGRETTISFMDGFPKASLPGRQSNVQKKLKRMNCSPLITTTRRSNKCLF